MLEERDVQIRGYKIRLPLDVVLVASANPEDYTNRGRIITPLKDRFGSQIRTHYPLETELEIAIVDQEARPLVGRGLQVTVPEFMTEIVAEISQHARQSPHVNQRSGVSARLSIANYETLVANAARRVLAQRRDARSCPRLRSRRARRVDRRARSRSRCSTTAATRRCSTASSRARCSKCSAPGSSRSCSARSSRRSRTARSCTPAKTCPPPTTRSSSTMRRAQAAARRARRRRVAGRVASGVEFVLEGLHLTKRLNKDAVGGRATYRARG